MKILPDREMLELAARAAGIEHGADRIDTGISLTGPGGRHTHFPKWNPLDDDGDALRLAAALGLIVEFDGRGIRARTVPGTTPEADAGAIVDRDGDHLPLVRRTIVRAASMLAK